MSLQMPIKGMADLKKSHTTPDNLWRSIGDFEVREIDDPFISVKSVKNRTLANESDIQLGAIVKFKNLKKDVQVLDTHTVFLGLDCPEGFQNARGHTLSNNVKILTKSRSEPFMRICNIQHVEKVYDTGDVQQNLKYLKNNEQYGENFVSRLHGLKIGGFVAAMTLGDLVELEKVQKGPEAAAETLSEGLSKLAEGDYIESRGSGIKILNMETAGMFEEMNEEARQAHARQARLKRFEGFGCTMNPYIVSLD